MANQNQIIGSDMANSSITTMKMQRIRWTIREFSKIKRDTKMYCPDFYFSLSCMCCYSLLKDSSYLYLKILNKSDTKIEIVRTLVLSTGNNKTLHEERDRNFSIEKNEDMTVFYYGSNPKLTNDTLIIDLYVNVVHTLTETVYNIDPERKLAEDFKSMLKNPINSDVCLQVGDEQIPAHWAILCSRSPYFKRMYDSNMKERVQNSVTITDLSLDTSERLVQFLYAADFVHSDDLQELFDLYYAADKYEVMDLRALCGSKIISNATAEKACEIFHLSRRHNDKPLKMKVLDFIRARSDAVLKTEGWKQLEESEPETAELISFFLKK